MRRQRPEEEYTVPVVSMTKSELAQLYLPHLTPHSAVNTLMNWVKRNPDMQRELAALGYRKTQKLLSPSMVEVFFRYLGEP